MQASFEKLKTAYDLSTVTCDSFIQVEARKQSDRSGRNTPGQSMTSTSMFSTFREDVSFPPIIDSTTYKQSKHLGLCKKIHAPVESESTTDRSRSDTSVQINQVIAESQILEGSNLTISVPGPSPGPPPPPSLSFQQPKPAESVSGSIPPPPPGGIPPPPPMGIGQLLAMSDQKRKIDESAGVSAYGFGKPTDDDDQQESNSNLSYKDQLAMMISKTQGTQQPVQAANSLNDDPKEVKKRSILASALAGHGQKVNAGGFFDDEDDEEDMQPSLLKKKKKPTEVATYNFDDETPTANVVEPPKSQVKGDLLGSILTGEKAKNKVAVEEENPFAKRTARPKKTIFDDDEEKSDNEDQGKKKKATKFLDDESDEEKERAKLLKKYGKDAPKKDLLGSDDEIPLPKIGKPKEETKKKEPKKTAFMDDSDEEIPLPKAKPPKKEEPKVLKPTGMDLTLDQPKESDISTNKRTKKAENPPPKPQKVEEDFPEDEPAIGESLPQKVSVKGSTDFFSKLNSQLGTGPKQNIGLIKSVLAEDIQVAPIEEDEPNLLNPSRRSVRGSIDDRTSVKPASVVQYANEEELWKTAPGQNIVPYRPSNKRLMSGSISNTSQPTSKKQSMVIQDTSDMNSAPKPVKKIKAADPKPVPEVSKPIPEEPKPSVGEPTMLRGKRKDPFASSSNSEDDAPEAVVEKPPVVVAEKPKEIPKQVEVVKPKESADAAPAMLRGKRKDPFASSESEEEDNKAPPVQMKSPPPQAAPEGRKNKLLGSTEEPEKPKEVPKEAPKKSTVKKSALLADDSDDDLPMKKPAASKKARKPLLADSDDDLPQMPKKKPPVMVDSEDEKPKAKTAKAANKKKLFDDDSD